ncbi:MAG TPA: galactokinase [Anaerolineae bacterium]|nr:galactokinase [Anaerolineae bacterium]
MIPIVSIILAAGKGTRMGSADRHKVCFPIDGVPAIRRALATYRACGINRHVVVVGALAEQVMSTVVEEQGNVIFAYQAEQRGTGHAARQGAQLLQQLGYDGAILVVAGDKVIEPAALQKLIDHFESTQPDLALIVGPRRPKSDLGRIVTDRDGYVLACVELADIQQHRAFERIHQLAKEALSPAELAVRALDAMHAAIPDKGKAALAFSPLWQRLQANLSIDRDELLHYVPLEKTVFSFMGADGPQQWRVDEVDSVPWMNFNVLLFRAPALYDALSRLSDDNAQREEYLTDTIRILAEANTTSRRYRVIPVLVDHPNDVLAFNNPQELLAVEDYFRLKKLEKARRILEAGLSFRTIDDWIVAFHSLQGKSLNQGETALREALISMYGEGTELLQDRIAAYLRVLDRAREALGNNASVLLVRSPGQINIMGRHIDHQGGWCNLMAIDKEILMAVHPRDDDVVHLINLDDRFQERRFAIGDLLAELTWDDWLSLVNSDRVQQMVAEAAGDWGQYVKAAVLRLQKQFPNQAIRGMDLIVYGNIPIAAGLSSSSAVVVATAEATVAVNGLDLRPRQFVDLCGEGEWFVGTRGGVADHTAMKFGQKGMVVSAHFFPFEVGETVPFPPGHSMVICDSHIKAEKAAGARRTSNQRVRCYHIGVQLVKRLFPQYAPLITHLRDVNTQNLGIPLSGIYRILAQLPEAASREMLGQWFSEEELHELLGSSSEALEPYPIRGVMLFGLAEMARSRLCLNYLKAGDVNAFGEMMRISHDGDRVVRYDALWKPHPWTADVSTEQLWQLVEDLESGDPDRVLRAQLYQQPGGYACSAPEIDLMVDVALRTPGVLGAQLAGAGLGGCMMALVEDEAIPLLRESLTRLYYEPRGLEPAVSVCVPVTGSGVLLGKRQG